MGVNSSDLSSAAFQTTTQNLKPKHDHSIFSKNSIQLFSKFSNSNLQDKINSFRFFLVVDVNQFTIAHCLKSTQNVAFESFNFVHFPPFFVLLKLTCLVTLFDRKLQVFKNSPKLTICGTFNKLLSTQNVNVARFARNVEE